MCTASIGPAFSFAECEMGPVYETSGLFWNRNVFWFSLIYKAHNSLPSPSSTLSLLSRFFTHLCGVTLTGLCWADGFHSGALWKLSCYSLDIYTDSPLKPSCSSSKKKPKPIFLTWKCLLVFAINVYKSVGFLVSPAFWALMNLTEFPKMSFT